jgi:Leucine-rich repeat (LRR) protein
LISLKATDLEAQNSTLATVDFSYNQLSTVPTGALATLSNLTSIDLSSNNIGSIDAASFTLHPAASVRAISLSYNPITKLDPDSFGGNLPSTLWNLSMSFCKQLTDSARQIALKPLSNLRNLNLASCNLNSVDGFIGKLIRYVSGNCQRSEGNLLAEIM